jgi:putative polyhydroxyalkanoate system protein
MAHIDERRKHSKGKDKAREAAEEIAQDIGQKIGAKYRWEGDDLRFERSGAKGSIHVDEGEVRVQVELGLLLRPLKGKIESAIRDYMDRKLT